MTPPEAIDPVVADFEAFRRRARARSALPPSGGGPTDTDLERRVARLETSVDKIDGIIDTLNEMRLVGEQRFGAIAERLASIDAKLDSKASANELADIRGRVGSLPTTWQLICLVVGTIFTILGGSFLILRFGLPRGP